jgi:hypothetical protein
MNTDGTEESKWGDDAQSVEEIMTVRLNTNISGIQPFTRSARAPPASGLGVGGVVGVGEVVGNGSLKVGETVDVGANSGLEVVLVVDDPGVVGTTAALFAGSFKAFNASTTPRS